MDVRLKVSPASTLPYLPNLPMTISATTKKASKSTRTAQAIEEKLALL